MGYQVKGQLLEVCTCNILCPCWVGEDPDGDGYCDAVMAWHIDRGTINGTDVSDLTMSLINHIPGNVLAGNWKVALFVDDKASDQQHQANDENESGRVQRNNAEARIAAMRTSGWKPETIAAITKASTGSADSSLEATEDTDLEEAARAMCMLEAREDGVRAGAVVGLAVADEVARAPAQEWRDVVAPE